jgi:hypothetical protein
MKKYARLLCITCCLLVLLAESAVACRLWAVIALNGHTLSETASDNSAIIAEELAAFYNQGAFQPHGWSLGYYRGNQIIEGQTLLRSQIPSTQDPARFESVVRAILDSSQGTKLAIGHLRTASSGAVPIPDPHPFLFTYDGVCYSFVLNGTFEREPFMNLLTRGGKDSSWLMQHPPQTYGNGDWRNQGFTSIVATELYFSWIVKNIAESGDLVSGLSAALVRVYEIIPGACSRNIIFSDGKRLFVSGGSGCLNYSAAPYTVVNGNKSSTVTHSVVMTEPPTTGVAGAMAWTRVLDNQLVVLSPDTTEIYAYDALKAIAKRNAIIVNNAFYYDNGGDGYIDSIHVTADSAVTPDRVREIGDSSLIGLPDQRRFTIRNINRSDSSSFAITVTQDISTGLPVTNALPYDRLTTHGHRFAVGGRLFAADTAIHDRIAPVVVDAEVHTKSKDSAESVNDTLWVRFSEPVRLFTRSTGLKPFNVKRLSGNSTVSFTPTLTACSGAAGGDSMAFLVEDFNDPEIVRFMEADSLWINTEFDTIGDIVSPANYQKNAANCRCTIHIDTVYRSAPPVIDIASPDGVHFRVRANFTGDMSFRIFSLAGRRIYTATIPVRKNQWVTMQRMPGVRERPLARGILLYALSAGGSQKQGFFYSRSDRQPRQCVHE